jgi:glycosyltransferase involved in cell wall biosynthesis
MPDISVVIPCFNARQWIGETLATVFEQGLSNLDVIVVDDGSTDGSSEYVIESFADVRVVRVDNGGPSRARNVGTRLARGSFIQYVDADDLLAPGKLDAQMSALAFSGADIAYGDWRELKAQDDGRFVPGRVVSRRIEGDPQIALFTDFWCPPAAYLFRRSIVERVGGWDEDQHVIEDVRFVLTCALAGARFVASPALSAFYRVHQAGSQSTRDPSAFSRGCLRNASTLQEWWRNHGGLSRERRAALVSVYAQVARGSFGRDNATFEAAYGALKELDPHFTPGPWQLALASKIVGYRSAEALAWRYRGAKRRVVRALPALERR